MKIIFRSAAMAALLIMAACGKDSADDGGKKMDEQAEQLEKTPLEANTVADNVVITGASKNDGVPPTPNEAISLDVSKAGKTAFLNEGFEIPLNSDGEIAGAYIQFKANDGTVADSYYDVDINANSQTYKKAVKDHKMGKSTSSAKPDADATLDVDFNGNIAPGTFCYVICVYDGEGNISAPSEVCVTVESWGGNSALVGTWKLTKIEETYEGETSVMVINEADCETDTYQCADQNSFEYTECSTLKQGTFSIKADGSFTTDFISDDKDLDYTVSSENCAATYTEGEFRSQSEGNWAYALEETRLTLVEYKYSYEEYGETESETYAPGEGELVIDGTATVNGNTLLVTEGYDTDEDGVDDELYKYYFSK